ncbi:hypothetical protein HYH02_007167 [Chlamydomonas schloesseri]|uniref:J domain-containing protein n=1 Tax=Chlamydomonas schloesseri TaxID=2026947 RepID=A0A835WHY1_9CHLO|nr:hypothetical protein HYH02_007167 [Chlamydomonas schloesseri]|eukprot:KAG2447707.1 hypothetical protein HYH02_007167 [Chlamydomonas schloesseri]
MLGIVLRCIQSTSSREVAAPLVQVAWAALGWRAAAGSERGYAAACEHPASGTSLKALLDRGVPVSVLEFEISATEAVRRFNEYQRTACMGLHAHSLLDSKAIASGAAASAAARSASSSSSSSGSGASTTSAASMKGSGDSSGSAKSSIAPAYLPFWVFDAEFSAEARACLGFKDEKTKEVVWKEQSDPMQLSSGATAAGDTEPMQVYASYQHVREVGNGAAGAGLPGRARPLTAAEAAAGEVGGVALTQPAMRQGLAWALAVRALTQAQVVEAEARTKAATGATDLKEVHVALQLHRRSARLVYLPAYIAVYVYGTRYKQGTSGVILPQVFTAAIGGTRTGRVQAPQHVSPTKASLGTGGLVGGLGLMAGGDLSGWLPPLLGLEPLLPQLGAVEALTLAALAASGAGMWAHQRPANQRSVHVSQQVRADYEFYKQYDRHEALGSGAGVNAGTGAFKDPEKAARGAGGNEEYMLWLWADADWRRWEHDEPWNWDEEERRKWAEDLWRKQALRRLERQRYVAKMEAEAARRAEEEEAEERRERLYGSSARFAHHRPRDHGRGSGPYAGEGEEGGGYSGISGGGRRRGRSDFLGYYRVLGLQDAEAVSSEDIKAAFKQQALLLHPDKHVGAEGEAQRKALVQFQKLQIAYDTLKDAEKRRLYDRGQFVE